MPTTGCSSVGGARNLVPQFPRLCETRIEVLSPRGCPEHSMAAGRMCDQRAGLRHHREQLWRVCGPPPAQDGAKGYGKRAERDVRAAGRHQSGRVWILNRVVRRGPGDQVTFM